MAKEERLKRYRFQIKEYRQNRTFENNKKNLPACRGRTHENISTTGWQ